MLAWGKFPNSLHAAVVILLFTLVTCPTSFAQGPIPETRMDSGAVEHYSATVSVPQLDAGEHKFWDKQNKLLFGSAAALNGADFAVTRSNLQNRGRELNPIVRTFGRSTPALAVNFVGETAGVIGLSYFFHKTGHHKLERLVSVVNIGASAGAVSYGLAHR
jgi:hypothetical protein